MYWSLDLMTLRLEKEIIVLEKSREKVLNFGFKNLYEPCIILLLYHGHFCRANVWLSLLGVESETGSVFSLIALWDCWNNEFWPSSRATLY